MTNQKTIVFTIWKANVFFTTYIVFFILISKLIPFITTSHRNMGLIVQLGMILPFILLGNALLRKETGKKIRIINDKIRIKDFIKLFFIAIFSRQVFQLLNGLIIGVLPNQFDPTRYSGGGESIILSLLTSCIIVGICEELLFRGVLYEMFMGLGKKYCMIITSLLFAINHFDIYNLLGTFFMGCMFFIIRDRAASVLPAIFVHILNNAQSLFSLNSLFNSTMLLVLLLISIVGVILYINNYLIKDVYPHYCYTRIDTISFLLYSIPVAKFIQVTVKLFA